MGFRNTTAQWTLHIDYALPLTEEDIKCLGKPSMLGSQFTLIETKHLA